MRPFVVTTAAGTARVLGTRFHLFAGHDELAVVVVEGRVALAGRDQEVHVGAGQATSLVRGSAGPVVDAPPIEQVADWLGDFLIFQDTPLATAMLEVARRYGREVEIADPVLDGKDSDDVVRREVPRRGHDRRLQRDRRALQHRRDQGPHRGPRRGSGIVTARGIARLAAGLSAAALATPLFVAALAAQDAREIALLRGRTGVEPEPGSLLATPARFSVAELPLADALARLSERSRVQIAFSPSLLPPDHLVACACDTLNIARALDRLLGGTELGYVELGTQVIVVPLAPPEVPRFDATIRGRVRTEVAAPLDDAIAILRQAGDTLAGGAWALTDRLGYFAFHDLTAGDYTLTVGRIGYATFDRTVTVAPGTTVEIGVELEERAIPVEGIQVGGLGRRNRMRFRESAAGTHAEMFRHRVRSVPVVAEADPVRAVDALPGVTRVSEIGASFNVRGGSADQNLVLLDGVPIFNPFHMLGIFSVFNVDMVRRTELRSGGFPAEFGGRASSVLLVESDLGDGEFGVDAGHQSPRVPRLAVSGGLPDEVTDGFGLAGARWRISGRRSYADVLANPFMSPDLPFHLKDHQFGFESWTRGGSRLRITHYSGPTSST